MRKLPSAPPGNWRGKLAYSNAQRVSSLAPPPDTEVAVVVDAGTTDIENWRVLRQGLANAQQFRGVWLDQDTVGERTDRVVGVGTQPGGAIVLREQSFPRGRAIRQWHRANMLVTQLS